MAIVGLEREVLSGKVHPLNPFANVANCCSAFFYFYFDTKNFLQHMGLFKFIIENTNKGVAKNSGTNFAKLWWPLIVSTLICLSNCPTMFQVLVPLLCIHNWKQWLL